MENARFNRIGTNRLKYKSVINSRKTASLSQLLVEAEGEIDPSTTTEMDLASLLIEGTYAIFDQTPMRYPVQ